MGDMKQSKVILLGEIHGGDKIEEETSSKNNNSPPRFGQLVQMEDGTFVIVNCDEDSESLIEAEDQSQEGSQDAVQTLINAVQELIQTHEATEHSENKEKQDCL